MKCPKCGTESASQARFCSTCGTSLSRISRWLENFREKEGRKGLVPWLSFTIQKWMLVGVVCISALLSLSSISSGAYVPTGLLFTGIAVLALYVGFRTRWLGSVELASKPVRILGAVIVCAGVLAVIASLAIMVIVVLVGILVLLGLLSYFLGGGGSTVRQGGKTYHQDLGGNWKAEKDFMGNDKVERDWMGNPKVERDWMGNEKIERDWKGDPKVPPEEKR